MQEGAVNVCDKPVCCSPSDGKSPDAAHAAGHFGDYHCDLPKWTFEEMVR
jgi:hypothetical protein